MNLLTHNLIKCNMKKCINGYPLRIGANKIDKRQDEIDDEFVKRTLKKVDLNALIIGSQDMKIIDDNSALKNLKEEDIEKKDVLNDLKTILFKSLLIEGILKCPDCGTEYPVKNGIPDMVVNDD